MAVCSPPVVHVVYVRARVCIIMHVMDRTEDSNHDIIVHKYTYSSRRVVMTIALNAPTIETLQQAKLNFDHLHAKWL